MNAVSIAPVQVQATPIVSIASIAQPQTQIIASSTPLAMASTQQAGQILGTPQITLATGKFTFVKCFFKLRYFILIVRISLQLLHMLESQ